MNIGIVGGRPAGLYLSLLMKKVNPSNEIRLAEVNPPHHTYGRLWMRGGRVHHESLRQRARRFVAAYEAYLASKGG